MQESSAMETIVRNIKVLLKSREWTQGRLADACGIPQPNMSRILNGQERLSVDRAERIAVAFNLSLSDLLNENLENLLVSA